VLGLHVLAAPALAQDSRWRAEHDAGWSAYRAGRFAEAERRLRASEKAARALAPGDPNLATVLDHLAWVLMAEGRVDDAGAPARSALALRRKALGDGHPDVVKSLNTLAALAELEGKPEEAKALYLRELAQAEKLDGKDHTGLAKVLDNLATVHHL